MDAGNSVSVPALRMLTYTILTKAVISAVILVCTVVTLITMRFAMPDMPWVGVTDVIAQTAGFVNTVACAMCLVGICSLSKYFIYTNRIMVLEMITQCVVM